MPTTYYVVFDVGCIECGEPSKVVGVYRTLKSAEVNYLRYLKSVGASEDFKPSSGMKLFLKGKECIENGEITEQGYFDGGQHSVEIHKWVRR